MGKAAEKLKKELMAMSALTPDDQAVLQKCNADYATAAAIPDSLDRLDALMEVRDNTEGQLRQHVAERKVDMKKHIGAPQFRKDKIIRTAQPIVGFLVGFFGIMLFAEISGPAALFGRVVLSTLVGAVGGAFGLGFSLVGNSYTLNKKNKQLHDKAVAAFDKDFAPKADAIKKAIQSDINDIEKNDPMVKAYFSHINMPDHELRDSIRQKFNTPKLVKPEDMTGDINPAAQAPRVRLKTGY